MLTVSNLSKSPNFKATGYDPNQRAQAPQRQQIDPRVYAQIEAQKKQNKREAWSKAGTFAQVCLAAAFVAMAITQIATHKINKNMLKAQTEYWINAAKGGGGTNGVEAAMEEAQKLVAVDLKNAKGFNDLTLGKALRDKTDEVMRTIKKRFELQARGQGGGLNLMLYGLPGGGKTAWVEALGKYLDEVHPGSKLYILDPTKTGSIYKDGAEKNVQGYIENFIKTAKEDPDGFYTLFIDEFDTFARKPDGADIARSEKMQNVFKRIFDAMKLPNVNIIMATNKASEEMALETFLDDAIVNRIDDYVHVPLPESWQFVKETVARYLKIEDKRLVSSKLTDEKNKALNKLFDYLAEKEHNASFRDLGKILGRAKKLATADGKDVEVLTKEQLDAGLKSGEIVPESLKHLKQAVIEFAESKNWHVPDDIINLVV